LNTRSKNEIDLLIISQYFTPDVTAAAFRWGELNECLLSANISTHVFTTYPFKSKIFQVKEKSLNITRVCLYFEKNFFLRLLNSILFFIRAILFVLINRKSFKNIIITTPPISVGLIIPFIRFGSNAKLILDVRDLWPDSILDIGKLSERSLIFYILKKLEKYMYNNVDHIICVSETMKQKIQEITSCNVDVIFNGIKKDRVKKLKTLESIHRQPSKCIRLVYAGNIGLAQNILGFLKKFNALNKHHIFLEIIGSGAQLDQCIAFVKETKMENVEFMGAIPKDECMRRMADADILLLPLVSGRAFSLTIPSKVFDYILFKKPILTNLNGEALQIMNDNSEVYRFGDSVYELQKILPVIINNLGDQIDKTTTELPVKYYRESQAKLLIEKILFFDDGNY